MEIVCEKTGCEDNGNPFRGFKKTFISPNTTYSFHVGLDEKL